MSRSSLAVSSRSLANLLPLACLLAVGALLGLTNGVVKLAHDAGWPLLVFLALGTLGGGAILLAAAWLRGQAPRMGRSDLAYYLTSGLVSIAAPNALTFSAVPHVGVGFVSLCLAFPPLLTYALAVGLRMERLRWVRACGIVLGLAGAVALALAKSDQSQASGWWIAAALAAPVFLAVGNIYRTRYWPAGAAPLSLAPGMLLAGGLFVALLAWQGGQPAPGLATSPLAWGLALGQVTIFAASYALYFLLQKLAGPVYLSQIGSVGAVCGTVLAVLVFGETADGVLLAAGAAVLGGVLLVNRSK